MIIHWCELCAHAPSDGILEVIDKETMEKDFKQCCLECVNNLDSSDWIENAI